MKLNIKDIKLNSHNPRDITPEQFAKLKKSLQEFPQMLDTRPLVIDENNVVLGGNMRLRVLQDLGFEDVPVKQVTGWTEEQKKEFIVKDNLSYGMWDWEMLANEWDAEQLEDWGLEIKGWEEEKLEAQEDNFEVPDEIQTDIQLGDIIEIGEHRLMCGDSTDIAQVEKLMNGGKADMVFTDPPYGISHSGKGIKGSATENDFGEILNDDDVSIAIDNFNLVSSLFPNATLIYWGANYYPNCFPNGYGWLFWDKDREGNTFSGGEIAFVNKGVRFDVFKHRWHGMIKASEMGEKRVHPTQKPIELVKFCFENYNAGNLVADFFLGSGSTMVASHQLKRKCYGMELDPKYCQVIVDRMLKLDPELVIKINGNTVN
jgi:DNA modification methylase